MKSGLTQVTLLSLIQLTLKKSWVLRTHKKRQKLPKVSSSECWRSIKSFVLIFSWKKVSMIIILFVDRNSFENSMKNSSDITSKQNLDQFTKMSAASEITILECSPHKRDWTNTFHDYYFASIKMWKRKSTKLMSTQSRFCRNLLQYFGIIISWFICDVENWWTAKFSSRVNSNSNVCWWYPVRQNLTKKSF